MPGGLFTHVSDWEKILNIWPRKIDNEWHFLRYAYRQIITYDSIYEAAPEVDIQYKSERQYLMDELRGKND
jgi:uncharacterized protein Usg